MSTKYQTTSEVPTSVLVSRLQQLGDAIPKQNRDEFSMRVPAEYDRDADLVMPEAAKRLDQLQATNKELLDAMIAVRDDLLMRGSFDDNYQTKVVNVSQSIWLRFCEAITNAKQQEKG